MGTWNTSLFGDDVACDVRDEFVEILRLGYTAEQATAHMVAVHAPAIADVDDGPVFWLALAATQWKWGVLQDEVRARALDAIASGADLDRWEGAAGRRNRERVLAALRETLESPQPKARTPRRRKPVPERPSLSVPSPSGRHNAKVYQLSPPESPHGAHCQVVMQVRTESGQEGGGHICVLDVAWDTVGLRWEGGTLVVMHPAEAVVERPESSFFFCGDITPVRYEPIAR